MKKHTTLDAVRTIIHKFDDHSEVKYRTLRFNAVILVGMNSTTNNHSATQQHSANNSQQLEVNRNKHQFSAIGGTNFGTYSLQ